jgi:hypothetical protein
MQEQHTDWALNHAHLSPTLSVHGPQHLIISGSNNDDNNDDEARRLPPRTKSAHHNMLLFVGQIIVPGEFLVLQ